MHNINYELKRNIIDILHYITYRVLHSISCQFSKFIGLHYHSLGGANAYILRIQKYKPITVLFHSFHAFISTLTSLPPLPSLPFPPFPFSSSRSILPIPPPSFLPLPILPLFFSMRYSND